MISLIWEISNMEQWSYLQNRNRPRPRRTDLWFPGAGEREGVGWTGTSGFLDANCYIWNGWARGPYSTAQGTVCDWDILLYKRLKQHCNQPHVNLKNKIINKTYSIWKKRILHLFIHSSADEHLNCFHILLSWIILLWSSTQKVLHGHMFLFLLVRYLGIEIAGSYGSIMFNFWRKCQIVFQSDCTILHSYQQRVRVIMFTNTFDSHFFSIIAIVVGVKSYLILVWAHSSLITSNIKHLFMCTSPIQISFFREMSIQIICPFKQI